MLASILVLSALDFQLSEPPGFSVGGKYVFYLFKRSTRHAFQHALDHCAMKVGHACLYFSSFCARLPVERAAGLQRRRQVRLLSFQTQLAACVPTRARSPRQFPGKAASRQEMRLPRFRPPRLTRTAAVLPASVLPSPVRGTEIFAPELLQTPACAKWTSREHNPSTEPAPDRLAHKGWACAYPLRRVVPELNHQQIPPWNEWWTADESLLESGPDPHRKATAPR